MNQTWLRAQLFLIPLFAFACGSSESSRPADASAPDSAPTLVDAAVNEDGGEGDALAPTADDGGALPDAGTPETLALTPVAGLAVVHGDSKYTSSLLSLVDPRTGALVRDNCLNSGSAAPGLSQALAADVVVPSAPLPGNPLILIDRSNGNLVWVNPADCSVTRQISVAQGFKANPHDALAVTANKLYVTRYGSNPKPTTALDGGGDLLVLDLALGQPVARIDLAPFAAGAGIGPNPDRGRVLDDKLYVVLNGFNADFSKAAPGRVVVVDAKTDTVTGTIDLPGLQNCGPIAPVPGMPKALAVACAGAFADGADQIKASGIALIDTAATPPTVKPLMAAAFGRPLSAFDLAVVSAGLGFVVVPGDFTGSSVDEVWRFDFTRGVPQKVLASKSSFVLGGLAYDPASQRVFVGDADTKTPRVHVMDVSSGTPVELAPIDSDPQKGMLPRSLGLY
jgi:hypothetical protein